MPAARLPAELEGGCHCPSCGDELAPVETADPLAVALGCPADHRLFVAPEWLPATDTAMARRDPREVAAFWLSDPRARAMLNHQLAEMLRTILDRRTAVSAPEPAFCPVCGGRLTAWEQDDAWVRGLRCPADHRWGTRGGQLFRTLGEAGYTLNGELTEASLRQLVEGWLADERWLAPNLHDSVRGALEASLTPG